MHIRTARQPFNPLQYQFQGAAWARIWDHLQEFFSKMGHFDGILGFPQGAAIATCLFLFEKTFLLAHHCTYFVEMVGMTGQNSCSEASLVHLLGRAFGDGDLETNLPFMGCLEEKNPPELLSLSSACFFLRCRRWPIPFIWARRLRPVAIALICLAKIFAREGIILAAFFAKPGSEEKSAWITDIDRKNAQTADILKRQADQLVQLEMLYKEEQVLRKRYFNMMEDMNTAPSCQSPSI